MNTSNVEMLSRDHARCVENLFHVRLPGGFREFPTHRPTHPAFAKPPINFCATELTLKTVMIPLRTRGGKTPHFKLVPPKQMRTIENVGRFGLNPEIAVIVLKLVCQRTKFTQSQLKSTDRTPFALIDARQTAFTLLKEFTGATGASIGRFLKHNSRSVLWGIESLKNKLDTEPKLRAEIEALRCECRDAISKQKGLL